MGGVASVVMILSLGGALGLAPDEEPAPDPGAGGGSESPAPPSPDPAAVIAIAALAAAILAGRRSDPGAALSLRPPDDALVVFVPGHGQGSAEGTFAAMVSMMGLDPAQARYFDYRFASGQTDPVAASQRVPVEQAAGALNAFVAGVGSTGNPVWLVGFSKGGATVAELLAMWDSGAAMPPVDVRGATLLDPPIAAGTLGDVQSWGRLVSWIPDDGGYDPVECAFLKLGCHDTRIDLGRDSGVGVLVVRNPNAGITSFSDHPSGLRVVNAPDDGPGLWGQLLRNPLALPGRLTEAHESVLHDPEVARCIVEEMWDPGSCSLEVQMLPSLRPPVRLRTMHVL